MGCVLLADAISLYSSASNAGLWGRASLSESQYDFPNTREPQALSGSVSSPLLVTLVQQRNGAASVCPQLMSLSLRMAVMGCTSPYAPALAPVAARRPRHRWRCGVWLAV